MVFKIRIGFGLDHFGSDRIRILKFTNYRIGNFQSDPMHTFNVHRLSSSPRSPLPTEDSRVYYEALLGS